MPTESIGRDFTPEENAWNSRPSPNVGAQLAAANGGGRSSSGGGGALGGWDFGGDDYKSLSGYMRRNELSEYLKSYQRQEQDYLEGKQRAAQSRADGDARTQLQSYQKTYRETDERNRMIRDRNGVPEPGFAGTIMPQGGQREFTDLDMYKLNMQRNQQNGVGMFGGGQQEWKPSQYTNQPNPYQPRATELNNREAPVNHLRRYTQGVRG